MTLDTLMEVLHRAHSGTPIRVVGMELSIPYRTMMHTFRKYNLLPDGSLAPKVKYTEDFNTFLLRLQKELVNLSNIAEFLKVSRRRITSVYTSSKLNVKWDLTENHNELLSVSRKAEMFVMRDIARHLGVKLIRDTYTCASSKGQKAPYDCILERYGSIDVKSTVLSDKRFGSFNVANFTKGVKYAFLVLYDENRESELAVFAVPGKLVYGHSTIKITVFPTISKKYSKFLVWKAGG